MAKKQMTLGLINMFISEVENLFAPLTAQVEARESNLKIQADMTARKELNIFELTIKQAKLELELNETKRQIKVFTEYSYINGHRIDSVYEQKVRQVLPISHRVYSLKLGRVAFAGQPSELIDNRDKLRELFL